MFTIRKKLSATEGTDPNTRYDETCECVQSSFDGGATWVDNPSADPRTSPQFLNPGSDDKCDAAQGIANFVAAFLDGTYQAFNIVGISSWAIQIGFFFTPIGLLYKIALVVADGLISIGSITLQSVFDGDTYDAIRDIAYCHLNDDGKFDDQAAFDAFGAQLQTDIGGSAFNIVMALMFNLYGWVGFSNAALEYAEISDCSGATCDHCYEIDFLTENGASKGWTTQGGTWASGQGIQGAFFNSVNQSDAYGFWDFGLVVNAFKIECEYTKTAGSGLQNVNNFKGLNPALSYSTTQAGALNSFNTLGTALTKGIDYSPRVDLEGIGIDINSGASAATVRIRKLRVFYRGDIPAGWSDNCT